MPEQHHERKPLDTHGIITKSLDTLPIKRSQDFVSIYGNQIGVMSSQWDVTFSIGQAMTDNPNDIYLEQRALVSLSFQTAKALVNLLHSTIENHEREYGAINLTRLPTQSDQPTRD